ncbi:phage tail tape measure protein [Blautia obeum]|jgi:TP901 family phage tail tape measure protein|uniref:Phage tail tape measure protein n=1 Tax=Blautia obeum TaxID=40520 RepID=A0A415HV86_9FIRM|nr:phage tail tape measure protein [Blautia obeum]RHK98163.1 phage tail tape measure protein [Blautia obeum]
MSDFIAHIVGELDLSAARSQMDSFLSEYENKKIKITPEINSNSLNKAGQLIGQQITQGANQNLGKGKIDPSVAIDFSKGRQQVRANIKETKKEIRDALGKKSIRNKDAMSDAKKLYDEQERQEKALITQRKKNANDLLKQQLKNVDQLNKNKADIIKNQASGNSATVDSLKRERQQLQAESKRLKSEMKQYTDVYTPKEQSRILNQRRMQTASVVDKARASVTDKAQNSATKSNRNQIKYNIETGTYDARSSRMAKQLSAYNGQDSENITKAKAALQTYNEELSKLQNHFSGNASLNGTQLAESFEKMTKAGDTFKNTLSEIRDTQSKTLAPGVAIQSANKVATYYEENSKAVKKYGATLKELEKQYQQVSTVEEKANLDTAFKNIQSRISAEGLTGKSGIDEFKRAFKQIGQFAGIYGAIQNVIMEVPSKVISSVKDVDSAMTNLYKVTDESQSRYSKYLDTASKNAPELGRSISSYISQTSEWSKLGYSLDDSEQLSKLSSMYANVGEVSDNTAVSDMVTAMKAFNIQASDAESIIDQLNILGNNFATSSADLGEGLSNSASSLATAGNDLGHSLAMLTGMSEITQSAPEAGNALKILAMRVRGYDEETDSYTNDTEELSGAIADLTKTAKTPGGISLFTDDTKQTYKDTYTLMEEISEIYDDLTDKNRAELLEKLAGKNRGNQIAALIQGFQSGQVQKAYQDTLNSDGSAQQEQDRWLESIEAKQQQFESAFQKMATTTFSSDMFKGLVDGGTNLLNLFTNLTSSIGMLNTAAIGLGIFQGKTGSGKSTWEFAPCIFQMTYAA